MQRISDDEHVRQVGNLPHFARQSGKGLRNGEMGVRSAQKGCAPYSCF
jgi:hypothetical protein